MAIELVGPRRNLLVFAQAHEDFSWSVAWPVKYEGGVAIQPATDEAMAAIGRSWERLRFKPYRLAVYVLDRQHVTFEQSLADG